jgi:hypothetical protein
VSIQYLIDNTFDMFSLLKDLDKAGPMVVLGFDITSLGSKLTPEGNVHPPMVKNADGIISNSIYVLPVDPSATSRACFTDLIRLSVLSSPATT